MPNGQPHYIVFANEKGGTRKSTTAVHVAVALTMQGHKVAVLAVERAEELVLTVDGQVGQELSAGDRVVVSRGERDLELLRLPGHTVFSTLRRKLNWAIPTRG